MFFRPLLLTILLLSFPAITLAQGNDQDGIVVEVSGEKPDAPSVEDISPSLANSLRQDSVADLQARGPEAPQADLSIRGGTFENSGVRLGSASVYDPQTGHYLLELPISTRFLTEMNVLTGLDNSLSAFNATAGTLQYGFVPIENAALLQSGGGDFDSLSEDAYAAKSWKTGDGTLGVDANSTHFSWSGMHPGAFATDNRESGRMQWLGESSQTDLVAGYQHKSFAWPDMYAPRELHELTQTSNIESDELNTVLVMLNHKAKYGAESYYQVTSYFRRNHDHYAFDRDNKDLFGPFLHTTGVWALGAEGKHVAGNEQLRYAVQAMADEITSTTLKYGAFDNRSYLHASLLPGSRLHLSSSSSVLLEGGLGLDSTNRDGSHLSPLTGAALDHASGPQAKESLYASVSQTSQVPGYTALSANPAAGLFRGNSGLGRSTATNYEAGLNFERSKFSTHHAVFYRYDHDLVDWTYQKQKGPVAARTAENVNTGSFGIENSATVPIASVSVTAGYIFLDKTSDYGIADVDASFYALNYARHRALLSSIYRPSEDITVGVDMELRRQAANILRDNARPAYYLASLSSSWKPPFMGGVEIGAVVFNITNEHFEEAPGVPGTGRMAAGFLRRTF